MLNMEDIMGTEFHGSKESRVPWIYDGRIYKPGIKGLCQEIEDFLFFMKHSEEERKMRAIILEQIKNLVLMHLPDAEVETYGSYRTGLYLLTSDIDVTLLREGSEMETLTIVRSAIEANRFAARGSLKLIVSAKVPVLKFRERSTGIRLDITVNQHNGIRGATEINKWCQKWPMIPNLYFVVRQMLLFHSLGDVYTGGISSYALIIMIASFLKDMEGRLKAAKSKKKMSNTKPMDMMNHAGDLLIDFLDFYGRKYDFETQAISLSSDKPMILKEDTNIPEADLGILVVEDPLDVISNVTRASFAAMEVRNVFATAANELQGMIIRCRRFFPHNGFLHRDTILHVPDLSKLRMKISKAFNRQRGSASEESTDDTGRSTDDNAEYLSASSGSYASAVSNLKDLDDSDSFLSKQASVEEVADEFTHVHDISR